MGVLFVASLFVTRLNREWHVDALLERAGKGGPIVAGAAFAIAWTPCIGPTLGAILSAAALTDSAGRGAFLLAVYSAGLAIPFLLTAVAFSRMTTAFAVVKRHYQAIVAVGGLILIAMGVLIWTGELTQLNIEAERWLADLGLDFWNWSEDDPRSCFAIRTLRRTRAQFLTGATVSSSLPTASTLLEAVASRSREQTMRKRPVPISPSGRPAGRGSCSQPSRSTSNGFIRTSAAGNGQFALCWSIALEIASRFFASGEATGRSLGAGAGARGGFRLSPMAAVFADFHAAPLPRYFLLPEARAAMFPGFVAGSWRHDRRRKHRGRHGRAGFGPKVSVDTRPDLRRDQRKRVRRKQGRLVVEVLRQITVAFRSEEFFAEEFSEFGREGDLEGVRPERASA